MLKGQAMERHDGVTLKQAIISTFSPACAGYRSA